MPTKRKRMSDTAVQAKTGKTWRQRFTLHDKEGAKKMKHSEIATYLYDEQKISGWWSQMVAVEYEKERGLRKPYQSSIEEFKGGASKVITVPLSKLYRTFAAPKIQKLILRGEKIVVRKATLNKSMRITREPDQTSMDVNFYPKDVGKSQITIQHRKLKSATAVEKMKAYWKDVLERLNTLASS